MTKQELLSPHIAKHFECSLLHTKYPYWDGKTYTFNEEYQELQPKIIWRCKECEFIPKTENKQE